MDQSSALVSAGPCAWRRFHAARQRAEQNRACSRRGEKGAPHWSQFRISVITGHATSGGPIITQPQVAMLFAGQASIIHLLFIFTSAERCRR
jgi:hypothetical protein